MNLFSIEKKHIRNIFGIAGVVFVLLIICMMYLSQAVQSLLLPVVEAEKPSKGYIGDKIYMDGNIKLYDARTIPSPGNCRIIRIAVGVGDIIQPGDLLLEFDPEEAELDTKKKELERENILIETDKLRENANETTLEPILQELNKLLQVSQQEEKNYKNMEAQYNAGAVSLKEMEEAKNKWDQAKIDYQIKKSELDLKKSDMNNTGLQLSAKKLELDIANTELKSFSALRNLNGKIKSEISGIIASVAVESGNKTEPGQSLFEVNVLKKKPWVECMVDAYKAEDIETGSEVIISYEGTKGFETEGTILSKKYMPDKEKYLITCKMDTDQSLKLYDMMAVSVVYSRKGSVYDLIVPKMCINEELGQKYIFVLVKREDTHGTTVKKVKVELLEESDVNCAVKSTSGNELTNDSMIVTKSSKPLGDGMLVRTHEEASGGNGQ